MKIKLLTSRAGVDFSQSIGDEIDVSEAEGIRMIQSNQAVAVRSAKKESSSKKSAPEKATK
jgi:hypothetical protein